MPGYDAFLSYSHAADGRLAPAVQSALHHLAKPWYRLRALRVFRDKTSLSANPALWPSIERALGDSRWFIFLASPRAVQSEWVGREISWWLEHRDPSSLLIALTDGTVQWDAPAADFSWPATDALPRALSGRYRDEPLWVDLRFARTADNLSLRHSQFRAAVLDLASPLHGRPKDELDGDDVREHRRARRLTGLVTAALLLLTTMAMAAAWIALMQSRQSNSRELAAYSLARLEEDPEDSVQLALEAIDRAPTPEAEDALRQALSESRVLTTIPMEEQGGDVLYSPNGAALAVAAGGNVVLADAASGRIRHTLAIGGRTSGLAFSSDSRLIAAVSYTGKAGIFAVDSGREVQRLEAPVGTGFDDLVFSPDGALVATRGGPALADLSGDLLAIPESEMQFKLPGPDDLKVSMDAMDLVRVWRVDTGQLVSTVRSNRGALDVSFDPQGRLIATAGGDGVVRIWDAMSGEEQRTLTGHLEPVFAVAFTPDGSHVVTVALDGTVRRWDAATGTPAVVGGVPIQLRDRRLDRGGALSPSARYAIVRGGGDDATVYDTTTGEVTSRLRDFVATAVNMTFSSDERQIVANDESFVIVWDTRTGERVTALRGLGMGVNSAAFAPNAPRLATTGIDGRVRVWDIRPGAGDATLAGHDGQVTQAIWSADGTLVATVAEDRTARVWDAASREQIALIEGAERSISFSLDGRRLMIADAGGGRIWDVAAGRTQTTLAFDDESAIIEWLDFVAGDTIVVGVATAEDGAGRLVRWRASDGKQLEDLGSWATQSAVAPILAGGLNFGFSREAGLVFVPTATPGSAAIWNVVSGAPALDVTEQGYRGGTRADISRDGSRLAVASDSGIDVWDVTARRRLWQLPSDGNVTTAVRFSADRQLLATGNGVGTAFILDATDGRLIGELDAHAVGITSIAFSPDRTRVVTASQDNTVKVWLVATGRLVATFRGHRSMVFDARFDAAGRRIVTASADATARIFDCSVCVPLEGLLELVRQRPGHVPDSGATEASVPDTRR